MAAFSELVSTQHISIPQVGEIDNTNELLGSGGVRGVKTGTLDEAGACLLFAADYDIAGTTVTVIGVILGVIAVYVLILVLANPLVYLSEGMRASLTTGVAHMPWGVVLAVLAGVGALLFRSGVAGFRKRVLS